MAKRQVSLVILTIAVMPSLVWGHPGHAGRAEHSLVDGLWHPITGWDHVLSLIAVGLLGVRIGGRALWAVPAAFLGSFAVGGLASLGGISLPAVELMILASIFIPAALIARGKSTPLATATIVATLFGAFHGFAHLSKMPVTDAIGPFGIGLLASSAGLLVASVIAGLLAVRSAGGPSRSAPRYHWRLVGAALSLSAVFLIVST